MTISTYVNERKAEDGFHSARGLRRDYRALRRQQARERQAAYDALLANGPDSVRQYRDRSVRPRLGRQMREVQS